MTGLLKRSEKENLPLEIIYLKRPEIETKYITNVLIEEFIEQTVEKVKTTLEDWDAKLLLDCYF